MKYFTIEELCKSDVASKSGIDNTPDEQERDNLIHLIDFVLDPTREIYGKPIYVNSGFRCAKLNDAVHGSKTSQHLQGMAADITAGNREGNRMIAKIIAENFSFDQLIDEQDYAWIHVSFKNMEDNRNEILRIIGCKSIRIKETQL